MIPIISPIPVEILVPKNNLVLIPALSPVIPDPVPPVKHKKFMSNASVERPNKPCPAMKSKSPSNVEPLATNRLLAGNINAKNPVTPALACLVPSSRRLLVTVLKKPNPFLALKPPSLANPIVTNYSPVKITTAPSLVILAPVLPVLSSPKTNPLVLVVNKCSPFLVLPVLIPYLPVLILVDYFFLVNNIIAKILVIMVPVLPVKLF